MPYTPRSPDVDGLLLTHVRTSLIGRWPALVVDREKRATTTPVITISPASDRPAHASLQGPGLFDEASRMVNIWGKNEVETRLLATAAREAIESLHGQAPFHQVTAAGAVVINELGEPPQRYFLATLLTRRDA